MSQEDHIEIKEDVQLKADGQQTALGEPEGPREDAELPFKPSETLLAVPPAKDTPFAAKVQSHGDLSAFPILSSDEVVQRRMGKSNSMSLVIALSIALLCSGWLIFKATQMFSMLPTPSLPESLKTPTEIVPEPATSTRNDVAPYMTRLQHQIKKNWFPPKAAQSRRVMVVFKVHEDGSVSHLRITRPGGLASADRAALDAVTRAAPFDRLPKSIGKDADIQFTFDYNVFSGGGKRPHESSN